MKPLWSQIDGHEETPGELPGGTGLNRTRRRLLLAPRCLSAVENGFFCILNFKMMLDLKIVHMNLNVVYADILILNGKISNRRYGS